MNLVQEMIQNETDYLTLTEDEMVDFKFTKPGMDRLIVFDLDETLIHVQREGLDVAECDWVPDHNIDVVDEDGEKDVAKFSIRPHYKRCLEFVNKYFEVAVFTAGHKWFANPIVDALDPKGIYIQHRYFRRSCVELERGEDRFFTKNLRMFRGVDINKVLIVDNNVYSFAPNFENGIPIIDFFGSKRDAELLKVIDYLDKLKDKQNLRAANEKNFGF